tara:strand:- start:2453 stop:2947 length:495 start_codon:yes stop_codon:yes gene_type:complete
MENVKVCYYKDFNFSKLKFKPSIESHLGSMKKYELLGENNSPGIRIQFPKVQIVSFDNNNLAFCFPENSKGNQFFKKLKELNETQVFNFSKLKAFNDLSQDIVLMKYNSDTLYFTEQEHITTLNDITNNYIGYKAVMIASSEGLWSTETSYGNTWKIEQLKIYS